MTLSDLFSPQTKLFLIYSRQHSIYPCIVLVSQIFLQL
nr:MAG TPA: hypothetical protein [Caudoviricetes sp.]